MTIESREQDHGSARASRKSRGSPAIIEAGGSGGPDLDETTEMLANITVVACRQVPGVVANACLTAAHTIQRLQSVLTEGLSGIDAAIAACPVENPQLRRFGYDPDRCPKCGASQSQNCGPYLTAMAGLERTVRAGLTSQRSRRCWRRSRPLVSSNG